MSIIADRGRPGVADDDFEVDLEDDNSGGYNFDGDEEIEDDDPPEIESFNLPEGEEEGEDDGGATPKGKEAEEGEEDDDLTSARLAADEARAEAVRHQTDAIMRGAEDQWRIVQSEVSKAEMSIVTLGMHITQATDALAQARDAGDTRLEIQLQGKLQELHSLKAQIESAKAQAPTKEYILQQAKAKVGEIQSKASQSRGKKVGDGIVTSNPMAERWARQNPWMQKNRDASKYVVDAGRLLAKEGWDMNTPGFYAELSRRVNRAFPGIKASPIMAKQKKAAAAKPGRNSSAVAPARSSMSSGAPASKPAAGGKRYQLTIQDQSAMKRMNLDPQNPAHRKEFARSRIETGSRGRSF